jgi:hypothetical protein
MEKIAQLIQWGFVPDPMDPKHKGMAHPVFSMLVGCFLNLAASYSISKILMKFPKFQQEKLSNWARNYVMKFLVFYVIFMAAARFYAIGRYIILN